MASYTTKTPSKTSTTLKGITAFCANHYKAAKTTRKNTHNAFKAHAKAANVDYKIYKKAILNTVAHHIKNAKSQEQRTIAIYNAYKNGPTLVEKHINLN